jgi:hypothetical protein
MKKDEPLKLYAHTTLLYWWPVWIAALGLGIWSLLNGVNANLDGREAQFLASSVPSFIFIILLIVTLYISSVRLKGIRSAILIACIAVLLIILGLVGVIDDIAIAVPNAATWISGGAYLWIGGAVFALWSFQTLLIDKLIYYRVTPGQITVVKVIGGAERTYDARGLAIDHAADDFLRHYIFGLGAGDVTLKTSGADPQVFIINNVVGVKGKIKRLQLLSNVEPDNVEI